MSHSLETKIQVVILMAKNESFVVVLRKLQRRGTKNIPERHLITSRYHKFFETGQVRDRTHAKKHSAIIEEKVQVIQQILDNEPVNGRFAFRRKIKL